jgi:aquaporin Z
MEGVRRVYNSSPPTRAREPANSLGALGRLRLHWPEYLMETGELAVYLFFACAFATLLQHPASPVRHYIANAAIRRELMGLAMGATVIAIILSPWGQQSGGHFNPAVTLAFYRLGKVHPWDLVFYIAGHFLGATAGVALAAMVLGGAAGVKGVRYAATIPGYGDAPAFVAEMVISFILMITVLFVSNRRNLARHTPYIAGVLVAIYTAFESPLSGMSTNPARTFGPALYASYWRGLWIYFVAPPLGMLAAAETFLRARGGVGPFCAKLDHANDKRCIFPHGRPPD